MAATPRDPSSPAVQDALVVDLARANEVRTALVSHFQVRWTAEREDSRLGLVLLEGLTEGSPGRPRRPLADLDGLMFQLRRLFGEDLKIGKERTVLAPTMPMQWKQLDVGGVEAESHKTMAFDIPTISPLSHKTMAFDDPTISPLSHKTMGLPGPVPALLAVTGPIAVGPGTPGFGVKVGVVDTPLYRHPNFDLTRVAADQWYEPMLGQPARPAAGHSTFVTDLILSQAPGAEVIVRGVVQPYAGAGSMWDAAVAIADLVDAKVDVLNLSFGAYTSDDEAPLVLERAVEKFGQQVVMVAAAGNHGAVDGWELGRTKTSRTWPAACDAVIAVGASEIAGGEVAGFSPDAPWVDVLAPGVQVTAAYLDGPVLVPSDDHSGTEDLVDFAGGAIWGGTSFSAPVVTGLIAAGVKAGTTAAQARDALLAHPDLPLTPVLHPEATPAP